MSKSFARNKISIGIALKLAFAGFAAAAPDERPDFNDPAERHALITAAQGISEGTATETKSTSKGEKAKTTQTSLKLRSKFKSANQNTPWGNDNDGPETTLDNEPACTQCLGDICACAKQENNTFKFG